MIDPRVAFWNEFTNPDAKPGHVPKCQVCKQNEAIWAMQYMDGPDKPPVFMCPGWHYRGWKVTKVCDECKDRLSTQPVQKE